MSIRPHPRYGLIQLVIIPEHIYKGKQGIGANNITEHLAIFTDIVTTITGMYVKERFWSLRKVIKKALLEGCCHTPKTSTINNPNGRKRGFE